MTKQTNPKIAVTLRDYLSMTRPDYWIKNLLIIPGALFAVSFYHTPLVISELLFVMAICTALACANYVLNEYFDARTDKFHPFKHDRVAVVKDIDGRVVVLLYTVLSGVGLFAALFTSATIFSTAILFLLLGAAYNVPPIRLKDNAYIDVLSESLNTPVRFAMGWFTLAPELTITTVFKSIPPLSILFACWMGGAFLMAAKRLSEYRLLPVNQANLYRKSFSVYTENNLLISMSFYSISCAFFLGIFLIKNKIEMVISFPFFALLFAWYWKISLLRDHRSGVSEKLWANKLFLAYVIIFFSLVCALMFVDLPWLHWFLVNNWK